MEMKFRTNQLALLAALALAAIGGGCNEADDLVVAAQVDGLEQARDGSGPASLSLSDLPVEMELTADQQSRLGAALEDLSRARAEMWQERREHRQRGERGERRRGGEHRGVPGEFGPEQEHAKFDGPKFDGAKLDRRPFDDKEPPLVTFLEKSADILEPQQFALLAGVMAERRMQLREWSEPMLEPLMDLRMGRAAKHLGLEKEQRQELRDALQGTGESIRATLRAVEDGSMSREAARDAVKQQREAARAQAQRILSAEQFEQAEAFRRERVAQSVDRRIEHLDSRLERRADHLSRVLALDDAGRAQVAQILQSSLSMRADLLRSLKDGARAPEDVAYEVTQLEARLADQIRAGLTPEQATRFDAVLELVPRGAGLGASRRR